jgi:hypothetical protein
MCFAFSSPNRWLWMHVHEPPTGGLTNGSTNIVVEDGVAIVATKEGTIAVTHRLRALLDPQLFDLEGWTLSPAASTTVIGRSARTSTATPKAPGKLPCELAFDEESAALLYMRTEDSFLGFEELELDVEIPDQNFRWAGPFRLRKAGTASIDLDAEGTYSALWEISVRGRRVFFENSPSALTKDEAIAWSEERAEIINLREGSR